jgi:alkanesulfonate monooxygenase SsuD/methylene tetrahydromethanopterin reductase-like flavin-dependent oxidoreductase (luciferase family)
VLAGEIATIDQLSGAPQRRRRSGWMPEEFAAASAAHIFPKRHKHVRETIEICRASGPTTCSSTTASSPTSSRCGFGAKPVQKPHPPIYFSGLKDPKRSANRIAKYGLRAGSASRTRPRDRAAGARDPARARELGSGRSLDDGFDMCSMIWFVITDEPTDQTPNGKLSNLLVGTADQITDNLKRYKDAGMTCRCCGRRSATCRCRRRSTT